MTSTMAPDDDGSGVVALVTMAEAVARGPRPKRSLLFVWHTGEEYGSWGRNTSWRILLCHSITSSPS
jgi:acetylornithine deacetylase/succinyl-diaminopimelate desuccinylase-like protein